MTVQAVDTKMELRPVADSLIDERYGWRKIIDSTGVLWSKGVLYGDAWSNAARRFADGPEAAGAFVSNADGHFAVVYLSADWCFAATDRVGSIPINFARLGSRWVVGSEARRVAKASECREVEEDAVTALAMAGYTVGAATFYKELSALDPGEWVCLRRNEAPERRHYYVYAPQPDPSDDPQGQLAEVLSSVFEKTVASLDGRTVMVPLSAGLDSRLVVSGLHEQGYENVKCFSYGQPGNYEAATARRIAEVLGYPWSFVPHSPRQQAATFRSDDCAAFIAFADTLQAIPFQQDFHAVGELKRTGFAPPDAVFINGQSGDFITGNHIPKALVELSADADPAARWRGIMEAAVDKHFDLWTVLKTPERIGHIETLLRQDLVNTGIDPYGALPAFGVFEATEYKNRQSKYVVAGQRTYEWFGFEWRLPLWDQLFVDFWARATLAEKASQTLFSQTLRGLNWGGVWGEGFWPSRTITPAWISLPRFLAKVCHAPLGRESWHRFERQYLAWRMDTVCNYAIAPYGRVARDRRGHRNAISWHVEQYLHEKGIDLFGAALESAA